MTAEARRQNENLQTSGVLTTTCPCHHKLRASESKTSWILEPGGAFPTPTIVFCFVTCFFQGETFLLQRMDEFV